MRVGSIFCWGSVAGLLGLAPVAASAGQMPAMEAQNMYNGGSVFSQDSIFQPGAPFYPQNGPETLHQAVEAAETNISLTAAFMHTEYHENIPQGFGDDESGLTAGFGVGISGLIPDNVLPYNADLYTSLGYEFSGGTLHYGGHFLVSDRPASADDRAVFNRIEVRLGVGIPLQGGPELIPFIAAGYQAWNRNDDQQGALGSDEFYSSYLGGAGIKLDVPVTPRIVTSITGEALALLGAHIDNNGIGLGHGMGISAEQRVILGLDYQISGGVHTVGSVYLEHFNYAGFKATDKTDGLYEPLSTTTQFGANVGLAYSF